LPDFWEWWRHYVRRTGPLPNTKVHPPDWGMVWRESRATERMIYPKYFWGTIFALGGSRTNDPHPVSPPP
jgi:hypothetical protein